jgi:hypothetical protein
MMAQLAKSMAVKASRTMLPSNTKPVPAVPPIVLNRIDENYYLTLNPWKDCYRHCSISVPGSITVDNKWIWTSMILLL